MVKKEAGRRRTPQCRKSARKPAVDRRTVVLQILLTKAEHKRLKASAKKCGRSMSNLARYRLGTDIGLEAL